MPTLTDGISICMTNATNWLNEYGLCEYMDTISKYAPDVIVRLNREMDKIDEFWVKVRQGEKKHEMDVKLLILDWFISWRILIDSVRGLKI